MADPLEVLLADGVIDEICGRLKSGKEANITLVRRQGAIIAAKVYKDRATRSFKNNADYKEGRKVRNSRTARAMEGGGKFGRDAAEQEWKSAESDALNKLINFGGVRVPKPVMFYEGVLLMELVTDAEGQPAPRLIDVALDPAAAGRIYADLRSQMVAMLCCDLIHGDLSPYNILAAAAGPTIIDFPQVVSAVHSSRAEFFFHRDFDNVLRYVSGFDPKLEMQIGDGRAIWRAYVARDLLPDYVPPPPQPRRPAWQDRRPDPRTPRNDPRNGPRRDPRNDFRGPQGDPRTGSRGPDPRANSSRGPDPRASDVHNGSRGPDPRNGPRGPDPRNGPRGPEPRNGPRGPDPRNGPRGPDPRSSSAAGDPRGPRSDSRPDSRNPQGPALPDRAAPPKGGAKVNDRRNDPRGPRQDARGPAGPQGSRQDSRGPRQDPRPAPDPSTLRKVPPSALRPELRLDSRPAPPPRRAPPGPPPAGGHRRRPKRHF